MERKNKSLIIILCILSVIFILEACLLIGLPISKNNDGETIDNKNSRKIANIKKYDGDIPEFNIEITGNYKANITKEFFENLEISEFSASVADSYGIHDNTYVGIKLSDFMKALNLNSYTRIIFGNSERTIGYLNNEIDMDKTYLVFYKDGKLIDDAKVSLLAVNYVYTYSLINLTNIVID